MSATVAQVRDISRRDAELAEEESERSLFFSVVSAPLGDRFCLEGPIPSLECLVLLINSGRMSDPPPSRWFSAGPVLGLEPNAPIAGFGAAGGSGSKGGGVNDCVQGLGSATWPENLLPAGNFAAAWEGLE